LEEPHFRSQTAQVNELREELLEIRAGREIREKLHAIQGSWTPADASVTLVVVMESTKPSSVRLEAHRNTPSIKVVDDRAWLAAIRDTTEKYEELIKKLAK